MSWKQHRWHEIKNVSPSRQGAGIFEGLRGGWSSAPWCLLKTGISLAWWSSSTRRAAQSWCDLTAKSSSLGAGLSPGWVIPEGLSLGTSFLCSAAVFVSYFSLLEAGIQKKKKVLLAQPVDDFYQLILVNKERSQSLLENSTFQCCINLATTIAE